MNEHELTAEDAGALDALIDAGFDPAGVEPALRDRAERLARLLGLLDAESDDAFDPALIDVTLARIARAGDLDGEAELVGADREALDAWVLSDYRPARVPGVLRDRAERHEALASLVTAVPAESDGELVDRTMAVIERAIDEQGQRMRIEPERGGSGFRLADLVSVAAVLLIAGALLWPMFTAVRENGRRTQCQANMAQAGMAFTGYAGDNRQALPIASASLNGGTWWNVGKNPQQSNSANLYLLPRQGYVPLAELNCPGNQHAPKGDLGPGARDWQNLDQISYSYQIMFGPQRPSWSGPRVVVLSDRSPVVPLAVRGRAVNPFANSPNHAGRGQQVLFNDGSSAWLTSPLLDDGDNIWLPLPIEDAIRRLSGIGRVDPLTGRETPGTPTDTFVGP